ncbi:hypothetical protein WGM54_28495, partial [Paenibacillus polymyxa]|uniref:hypothetical protein n=1 Tax=Paenibacillus polymyxa TaxID=1406 RepID=UPI00307E3F24
TEGAIGTGKVLHSQPEEKNRKAQVVGYVNMKRNRKIGIFLRCKLAVFAHSRKRYYTSRLKRPTKPTTRSLSLRD